MNDCFSLLHLALAAVSPDDKVAAVRTLSESMQNATSLSLSAARRSPCPVGRPARPPLVHPSAVPKRKLGSKEGHAALIHAIAHIEFNAINLALDAAHRFAGLPEQFYRDWVHVAAEEAKHFSLLRDYLSTLGFAYGDFPAHDGLWKMAQDTAHDVLVRMALVPRVLEARGLDVTPQMRARLERIGDTRGVRILDVIARDEVGHVAIGSHWFRWACVQRGIEPEAHFRALITQYLPAPPRGPFAREARLKAGFSELEMDALERLSELGPASN
jgi:uncharacterized ferritin-like protein (DUF455 family)